MKRLWNKFIVAFINGIVIILPLFITISLIRFFVLQLNKLVLEPIISAISPFVTGPFHVHITKTIILIAVLFSIALLGWGAKVIFIKRFFAFGETLLMKLPIMGKIYNASKQIFSAFFGQGKTIFKAVVLIEYPKEGTYSLGFTTGETKGVIKEVFDEPVCNVFIPTTPNPTNGFYLIIPEDQLKVLDMSVEEGMKVIISGGSVSPLVASRGEDGGLI